MFELTSVCCNSADYTFGMISPAFKVACDIQTDGAFITIQNIDFIRIQLRKFVFYLIKRHIDSSLEMRCLIIALFSYINENVITFIPVSVQFTCKNCVHSLMTTPFILYITRVFKTAADVLSAAVDKIVYTTGVPIRSSNRCCNYCFCLCCYCCCCLCCCWICSGSDSDSGSCCYCCLSCCCLCCCYSRNCSHF